VGVYYNIHAGVLRNYSVEEMDSTCPLYSVTDYQRLPGWRMLCNRELWRLNLISGNNSVIELFASVPRAMVVHDRFFFSARFVLAAW